MFCLKKRLRNGFGSSDALMRYLERGREEEETGEEDGRGVSTTSMDEAGVAPSPSASGKHLTCPALLLLIVGCEDTQANIAGSVSL